jgi:hypothetical protein
MLRWSREDVAWAFTGAPMEAAGPTSRDTPRSVTLGAYIAAACTAAARTIAVAYTVAVAYIVAVACIVVAERYPFMALA